MDKTQQEIHYHKWQMLIEEHEKSGLTQIAFCKQKEIPISHFTYYRARIINKPAKENVFIPIHLQKQNTCSDIQILLPNGLKCIVPTVTNIAYIKQLVETLRIC